MSSEAPKFIIIYAESSWSGIHLKFGGHYPDYTSCCEALEQQSGMIYHLPTGFGIEVADAMRMLNNSMDGPTTIHTPSGSCFWNTRDQWYERIGEEVYDE